MAFKSKRKYAKRFYYEAGQTQVHQVDRGNLFHDMWLNVKLEVDIAAGGASNAPDFQIFRAMQKFEVRRNGDSMWSISGEALAAKFLQRRGVVAKSNAAIAGGAANNVIGKGFLYLPVAPDDAARPQDYAMDTRAHTYEVAITWRDLTAAGTLFGTLTGAITAVQAENYIDLSFGKLDLAPSPDGSQDAYSRQAPLMRGIKEVIETVTTTQDGFQIKPGTNKTYRGVTIWATHNANTLQPIGINTILTGKIVIKDSQEQAYHTLQAADVHENTSLARGIGSGLGDGIYDIPFTAFGNLVDEVNSNNVSELQIFPDVTKLANACLLHMIYDTTERQ